MTLSSTTSKVSYNGDGSTTSFPVTFKFIVNAHVQAILRDAGGVETTWTENTQYTLTGAGNDAGGALTVSTSPTDYTPASGETLVIRRVVPELQETDYPPGGSFPAKAHEDALDLLTMMVQAHSEEIARALAFAKTSTESGVAFPDREASRVLLTDASKNITWGAVADISTSLDTLLTGLAANDFLKYNGTNWINRTPANVRTDLGLGTAALVATGTADANVPTNADLGGNTRARAAMRLALFNLT